MNDKEEVSKLCKKCNQKKPLEEFGNDKLYYDGKSKYCKMCFNKWKKKYNDSEKGLLNYRKHFLKNTYGIDLNEYQEMISKQDGCCAICKVKEDDLNSICNGGNRGYTKRNKLCIDHNHLNGTIRGLLCSNCNSILAHAKDNIFILENAIKYLSSKHYETQKET